MPGERLAEEIDSNLVRRFIFYIRVDQFKPVVSGDVKNYHLSVYNRFGMLVFESYDYRKGWDGLVQGQNQNPGNFVWTCTYSVDDQISKTEKGSVLLVR